MEDQFIGSNDQFMLVINRKANMEKLHIEDDGPHSAPIFSSLCELLSLNFAGLSQDMFNYFSADVEVDEVGIAKILSDWHPVLNTPLNVERFLRSYGRYKGDPEYYTMKDGNIPAEIEAYDIQGEVAAFFDGILFMQAYADQSNKIELLREPEVFRAFINDIIGDSADFIKLPNGDYYSDIDISPEASIYCEDNIGTVLNFAKGLQHWDDEVGVFFLNDSNQCCATALYYLYLWGYPIKRCDNCSKFFIPLNRSDEIYCNNPSPPDPSRTCKEYGTQKLWYDRMKKDEAASLWRRVAQAKQKMASRYADISGYAEQYELFKIESKRWKSDVKSGIKTEEEFVEWLKSQKEKKV